MRESTIKKSLDKLAEYAKEDVSINLNSVVNDITRVKEHLKELEIDKKALEKALMPGGKDMTEQANMLFRHRDVESVYIRDRHIIITTKVLYTDIRLDDGVKEKKRRCLGAFSIKMQNNSVYLKNLLFPNRYHWATSSGGTDHRNMCLGDASGLYVKHMQMLDIYGALMVVLGLLRNADDDGGAYIRSHHWVNSRMQETYRRGDYVMGIISYDGRSDFIGTAGIVIESGSRPRVDWKYYNGTYGNTWYMGPGTIAKITKQDYIDCDGMGTLEYVGGESKIKDALDKMDKSKSMTIEEAKELLNLKHEPEHTEDGMDEDTDLF